MSVLWHCDLCSKATHVNPPTQQVFEEREIEVDTPEIKIVDGNQVLDMVKKKVTQKVPKLAKMKRQNLYTREVEEIDIPMMKDLSPRTYIMRVMVGSDEIQRDFCLECLDSVMPEFKALWDKLEKIKSVD